MKIRLLLSTTLILCLAACKPAVSTGYVEVPTVTSAALSGIYTTAPKKSQTRLYLEYAGKGDTLILLHGYGTDLRLWNGAFEQFARTFHVIRYDLRGYGRSDMPEEGVGYLHADDLKALMDALRIQRAHLAGVSLGGKVVTEFCALYPDRVKTATISSGSLSHIPDRTSASPEVIKAYNDTVFAANLRGVKRNATQGLPKLKTDWKKAMKQISGKGYSRIKKDLNRMIDEWSAWQWTHPEVDALMGDQADSLLNKQQHHPPILLLIGQRDYENNKKAMYRMAAICPDARLSVLPNVGHFSVMEDPKDFVKRVRTFVLVQR